MARDLAMSSTAVYAAYSVALLVSALLGPHMGRTIDRLGGREMLAVSNFLFAGGLVLLGLAQAPWMLWAGWLVLGVAMGIGLYDAAFATLGRIFGSDARSAITGITLLAGFASTVGWPLTSWGDATIGWRYTCFAWAGAHIVLGLPLNLLTVPSLRGAIVHAVDAAKPHVPMDRVMWLLGFALAAGWIVTGAMAAHLPRLLEAFGATTAQAVTAAALIGPAQVLARACEIALMQRFHALWSARFATIAHPIGAALLIAGGSWFAPAFAVLHGAGNGLLTIARGSVPLAVFGPKDYGYRLGLLGAPARIAQAAAPLAFGFLIERIGGAALLVSSALSLAACVALCLIAVDRRSR